MRTRVKNPGDSNIIGRRVEIRRKQLGLKQNEVVARLQIEGVDINASSYSKLEGQVRKVSDIEIKALCSILDLSPNDLLLWENK